jgi:hypothetical protein
MTYEELLKMPLEDFEKFVKGNLHIEEVRALNELMEKMKTEIKFLRDMMKEGKDL